MLRLLTAAHAGALYAAVEPARSQIVRWFEWPDRVTSPSAAADYIAEIQRCSRIRLWWLIYDGGAPVGGVQMRLRDGGESVSLPYWLVPSAQGRGLATNAVAAAMEISRAIGFQRAKFEIAIENRPSHRLAQRLGFSRVGEPRETAFRGATQVVNIYERAL